MGKEKANKQWSPLKSKDHFLGFCKWEQFSEEEQSNRRQRNAQGRTGTPYTKALRRERQQWQQVWHQRLSKALTLIHCVVSTKLKYSSFFPFLTPHAGTQAWWANRAGLQGTYFPFWLLYVSGPLKKYLIPFCMTHDKMTKEEGLKKRRRNGNKHSRQIKILFP